MDNPATNPGANQSEASSELIGLLTAISIVSKRMARRLALLDRQTTAERGDRQYGRAEDTSGAADQRHAI